VTTATPAHARSRPTPPLFYVVMGFVALFAALAGFTLTFFKPLSEGTFHAPPVIFLHAACAFGWVIVFAMQPWLIRTRRKAMHRQLGLAAIGLAVGFALTAPFVAAYAAARDYANGDGEVAISSIPGTFSSALIFIGLVIGGYLSRRDGGAHKRLMLLATIALLWPAWFRFRHYFPSVTHPEIVFAIVLADSLIVIAALRDLIVERRIHVVWLVGGTLLIAEHITEALLFDTAGWRVLAHALYAPFAP